jgi:hypothetical protein
MATYVATAHKLFAAGIDLSCYANQLDFSMTADPVECTTFCSAGSREYKQGLKSWMVVGDGYTDFAAVGATTGSLVPGEDIVPANQGAVYNVTLPWTGTEGSACYLSDGVLGNFTAVGGTVGDMAPLHFEFFPDTRTFGHRMVRGLLEANRTVTATSNTTGSNTLGAVSATQSVWSSLHVLTLSGTATPTITVKVQSDDNSGFTTPTDRITFSAATTRSGQYGSAAGAITDTYWRVLYTVSGTNPSIAFACSIGIL